jgi:hypothetical protein
MSASALLGVMAFLVAHERIRQPMKSIAVTKSPSSRFSEQQDAKMINQPAFKISHKICEGVLRAPVVGDFAPHPPRRPRFKESCCSRRLVRLYGRPRTEVGRW